MTHTAKPSELLKAFNDAASEAFERADPEGAWSWHPTALQAFTEGWNRRPPSSERAVDWPEFPEPTFQRDDWAFGRDYYTADQMRAYGEACRNAAPAKPCDAEPQWLIDLRKELPLTPMKSSFELTRDELNYLVSHLAQPQRQESETARMVRLLGDPRRSVEVQTHISSGLTLEPQRQGRADEDARFEEWFRAEQGKPYDGMWEFAKAAWMARADQPASAAADDDTERCESGDPLCGPVEFHDVEGVPLCRVCWEGLCADSTGARGVAK
jgi:hypothetical protein